MAYYRKRSYHKKHSRLWWWHYWKRHKKFYKKYHLKRHYYGKGKFFIVANKIKRKTAYSLFNVKGGNPLDSSYIGYDGKNAWWDYKNYNGRETRNSLPSIHLKSGKILYRLPNGKYRYYHNDNNWNDYWDLDSYDENF